MTEENKECPKCKSPYCYQDGNLWACPECFYEWDPSLTQSIVTETSHETPSFKDANGVILQTGDTVSTIKDLKVGKSTLKSGTKVKNIRLLNDPIDGHDISCKIDGFGSMYLKCSVVKKI